MFAQFNEHLDGLRRIKKVGRDCDIRGICLIKLEQIHAGRWSEAVSSSPLADVLGALQSLLEITSQRACARLRMPCDVPHGRGAVILAALA